MTAGEPMASVALIYGCDRQWNYWALKLLLLSCAAQALKAYMYANVVLAASHMPPRILFYAPLCLRCIGLCQTVRLAISAWTCILFRAIGRLYKQSEVYKHPFPLFSYSHGSSMDNTIGATSAFEALCQKAFRVSRQFAVV